MAYDDYECELYESGECAVLNMQDCEACPLHNGRTSSAIAGDIAQFVTLLPEGGVARLFESESCTLCREQDKAEKADGFAIIDMAHEQPHRLARKRLGKRRVGFVLPLQFACCQKCRKRLMILDYLTLIAPVCTTLVVVILLAFEKVSEALKAVFPSLPLFLMAFAIVAGYVAGLLWKRSLKKRYESQMYVDLTRHPIVEELKAKGWFFLMDERKVKPVFTKKRISRGLGSAPSSVYAEFYEESGIDENSKAVVLEEAEAAADSPKEEAANGEIEN